ncbi:unnamed protein product [Porites evermanni]|uniref:Centromere protein K n=1 Tax=Porites evermanni TaxID=104178 RepID=A0ABN8SH29_9CNID|nr:unnamed protein product [Porites evermanni]
MARVLSGSPSGSLPHIQALNEHLLWGLTPWLNVDVVRRSWLFNVSTSLEDQDVTGERQETAHLSEGHISAELQLRNECETLWQELNNLKTHARLEARTRAGSSKVDEGGLDGSKVLEKVLKVKEKKLQTELVALENQGLQVTSANPEYTGTCLRSELLTSITQLEETLEVIRKQRKEVEDELKREEEILNQHKEIGRSLQMKIESLEQEKENAPSGISQMKELEKQKKAADVYLTQIMRKLGSFLSTNFPLPSPDDVKRNKNQGKGVLVDPNISYISLQQLTEDLMNMLYARPHDPYIRIKDFHWPPYIELLLRCGIALRHPQDCNRIRLVAFNR